MPTPINRTPGTTGPTATSGTDGATYTIRPGDTLGRIAAAAGTSVDALVNLNKARYPSLETNRNGIQVGWTLTLPSGAQAPTTPGAPPANAGWTPRSNDKITFVAINNSDAHKSTFESDQLRNRGVNVGVIQDAARDDTITTKDASGATRTHDLNTPDGRLAFAMTLRLPAEQTQKIADAIGAGGDDIKDELAQLAQAWAGAERGEQVPSRLVFSGHHVGYGVYGENNGSMDWPLVKGLADAMPRAARSVEDLMIAGCYSGGQAAMEKYQTMFPNVKTIVAYSGSSPGSYSGATAHQKAWEQATRGEREGISRQLFQGMRKGENVTVWTKTHGFDDGNPPQAIGNLRSTVQNGRAAYESALRGETPVGDPQTGPTRQFYTSVQRLLQHPELPAAEKAQLEGLRDQCIRLIFYPVVSKRFGEAHGDRVANGFRALNLPVPDFKTLSRPDALKAINDFEQALARTQPPPAAASGVASTLAGFKDLQRSVIPDTWV